MTIKTVEQARALPEWAARIVDSVKPEKWELCDFGQTLEVISDGKVLCYDSEVKQRVRAARSKQP